MRNFFKTGALAAGIIFSSGMVATAGTTNVYDFLSKSPVVTYQTFGTGPGTFWKEIITYTGTPLLDAGKYLYNFAWNPIAGVGSLQLKISGPDSYSQSTVITGNKTFGPFDLVDSKHYTLTLQESFYTTVKGVASSVTSAEIHSVPGPVSGSGLAGIAGALGLAFVMARRSRRGAVSL
jgi:hypothetical protein